MDRSFSPRIWLISLFTTMVIGVHCLHADGERRYPELNDPYGPQPPADAPPPPPRPGDEAMNEVDAAAFDEAFDGEDSEPMTAEQLHALERFLEMSPEKLARMREAIERIESMSEAEKAAMQERIKSFRELRSERITRLREAHQRWRDAPPDTRQLLHRYLSSLSREERSEVRRQMVSLPPQEREEFVQEMVARAQEADAQGALPELKKSRQLPARSPPGRSGNAGDRPPPAP